MIDKTKFAISNEETRYYLNGIFLHKAERNGITFLRAVATDGHRLAQYDIPLPQGAEEITGVIISKKTIFELRKVLDDADGDVNISLNENDIGDFRTFLKLSPPLRTENDRVSLINAINSDLIDVIVSDHKPEDEESKRLTFSQAATGASGIEILLPLALELFHNESIKLFNIIKLLTSNPAKILKINKGNLSIGNDADFCIVDLYKPWVVKKEKMYSKSKNTCIKGEELFKI